MKDAAAQNKTKSDNSVRAPGDKRTGGGVETTEVAVAAEAKLKIGSDTRNGGFIYGRQK